MFLPFGCCEYATVIMAVQISVQVLSVLLGIYSEVEMLDLVYY